MSTPRNNILEFSNAGSEVVTASASANGPFGAVQCVTECTFTAFSDDNISGDPITSVTFPAGFVIYGKINSFTTATGETAIGHKV